MSPSPAAIVPLDGLTKAALLVGVVLVVVGIALGGATAAANVGLVIMIVGVAVTLSAGAARLSLRRGASSRRGA